MDSIDESTINGLMSVNNRSSVIQGDNINTVVNQSITLATGPLVYINDSIAED